MNKPKLLAATIALLLLSSHAFAEDKPEFVKNGDGTVTHNPTGLILKTCAEGQVWDGSFGICNGTAATYAAADALKLTGDFAGKTDWRLPTKEELKAIGEGVKFGLSSNANFTKIYFPQTPTSYFWSSSDGVSYFYGSTCPSSSRSSSYSSPYSSCTYSPIPYCSFSPCYSYSGRFTYLYAGSYFESKSSIPYSVLFNTGEYNRSETYENNNNVRLIRGTQWFGTLPKNTEATLITDFMNNQDGTVTHTKTGLTWQRCSVGQTWNEVDCDGTATPLTYEKATALTSNVGGNTDWRLPTFQELRSLIDKDNKIETFVFPHAPTGKFWSSINYTGGDKSNAFYVSFNDSYAFYTLKTEANLVRLVRGTPLEGTVVELNPNIIKTTAGSASTTTPVATGSVDLAPTITGTPNPATVNGNITFTATLTNKGTATATDAKLSFGLPKNTVSLVTKPDECNFTGLSVVCAVGNVVPNGSITKTVTVKMTKAGGLSFGVTSWANEKDVNTKDNIARTTVAIRK